MIRIGAIQGLDEVLRMLDVDDLRRRIARALEEGAPELLAQLQSLTPVDSGQLADSWRIEVRDTSLIVSNDAPYASFVRDGGLETDACDIVAGFAQSTLESAVLPDR